MRTGVDPQPGIAAKFPGSCARCDEGIARGDLVVFQRGAYIHVGCASGADDQ